MSDFSWILFSSFVDYCQNLSFSLTRSKRIYQHLLNIKDKLEIPCSFEKNVFPNLADNNLLDCFIVEGNMLDVGTRESYIYAHTENQSNWISESASTGKNVTIENSVILGSSSIGNNVQIKNSIICDKTIIEDGTILYDEIIRS